MANYYALFALVCILPHLLAGCGAKSALVEPNIDGSMVMDDSGLMPDAGIEPDTGLPDTGMPDTGTDLGTPDSGTPPDTCPNGIAPRQLIKASNPAIYWLATNCRRYVFTDKQTFNSWFPYGQQVLVISDAALAAIFVAGNVTIRPGTWLVKVTTDPKSYAITPGGVLHWIPSEYMANTFYGDRWHIGYRTDDVIRDVMLTQDVADAFFVNYTIGLPLDGIVHPDGSLIRYDGLPDCYYVINGTRRHITAAGFDANRWHDTFVHTTTFQYPDGPAITGYEEELSDPIYLP